MNQEWRTFLESQQATITNEGNAEFPTPLIESCQAALNGNSLIELSHLGLLKVTGEENKKFLQGQLTCNTETVTEANSVLGTYCNLKGRAHSSFRVFQRDEDLYLLMDRQLVPVMIELLKKYIVFSKAELADASDELIVLGLAGTGATEFLSDFYNYDSANSELMQRHSNTQVIQHLTARENLHPALYLTISTPNEAINLWKNFSPNATTASKNSWDLLLTNAGEAQVNINSKELFIPLELNLQALNYIDFKKGCYTGQEIIARLYYRGKAKQRLYIADVNCQQLPTENDSVYVADGNSQAAGHVVNAAWNAPNQATILAVIKNDVALSQTLKINLSDDPNLQVRDVPYAITNEEDE